ncbi:spore germination protein GerW family protein [uncultured Cellulomonas sp.]|uniref:spore germination protein GerW family protein n=1 Tax=uncultured Cellulomonas sp. TaxID=189682 RepID=UPI00261B577A|nr:spore germination protein GerW family protein [uncultured Cellulomonas sp.]
MDSTRPRTFDPTSHLREASEALSVRRVFGEAYTRGDALVIPVAKVMGGTGSGYGSGTTPADGADPSGPAGPATGGGAQEGEGGGGGFGVRVRPVGVYVVDDAGVRWQPALDLNRVVLGGQVAGTLIAVVVAWALGRRRA